MKPKLIDRIARRHSSPVSMEEFQRPKNCPLPTLPDGVEIRVGNFRFPGAHATTWNRTIVFHPEWLKIGTLQHELVHVPQWQKYGQVGFPFVYAAQTIWFKVVLSVWDWMHLRRARSRNIPLEAVAYEVGDPYHAQGF